MYYSACQTVLNSKINLLNQIYSRLSKSLKIRQIKNYLMAKLDNDIVKILPSYLNCLVVGSQF